MPRISLASKISIWCLILMMLASMWAWWSWNYRGYLIIVLGIVFIGIRLFNTRKFNFTVYDFNCMLFGTLAYIWINLRVEINISGLISTPVSIIALLYMIWMTKQEKQLLIKYAINTYAVILAIGIIIFIPTGYLFMDLPAPTLEYPHSGTVFYPDFRNYFFVIVPKNLDFFRFRSIFVEPGHLGMILSFLLYVAKYNYRKWQTWVMTLGLIMSLSFAGYVLYIVGLIIYLLMSPKNSSILFRNIAVIVGVGIVLVIGALSVPEDSYFYSMTVGRAEVDSDGNLKGNNRNTPKFEAIFDKFCDSPELLTGASKEERENVARNAGNSSWQLFIFNYGLIGFALVLTLYVNILLRNRSKMLWGMLALYLISFLQRPYLMWEVELFLFAGAAGYFSLKQPQKAYKKKQLTYEPA